MLNKYGLLRMVLALLHFHGEAKHNNHLDMCQVFRSGLRAEGRCEPKSKDVAQSNNPIDSSNVPKGIQFQFWREEKDDANISLDSFN